MLTIMIRALIYLLSSFSRPTSSFW